MWAIASLDDVKAGFSSVDYPSERVHFVEGKVEDTIPAQAPDEIAILRLDTDWYESTRHELTHLYRRLAPGGVLIIDDYGTWKGSKDATDEFVAETGEPLLFVRTGRGRAAVKPGLTSRVV
jgi:O-methyltransferase